MTCRGFCLFQHMYCGFYSPICYLFWSQMPRRSLPWSEFLDISILLCASPQIHIVCIHISSLRIYMYKFTLIIFSSEMVINNDFFYNSFLIINLARKHRFHLIGCACIHNYKLKILKIILNYQASLHCL